MISKPIVYFAGKISKSGWRTDITRNHRVGGLEDNGGEPIEHLFDPSYREEYDAFHYGGPFFVGCDHGCAHGPGLHANSSVCGTEDPDYPAILKVNTQRILRADWMFAFIDEVDCFGTLNELGIALRQEKPRIAVAFGPKVTAKQRRELWMAAQCAEHVYDGLPAKEAWQAFAQNFLSHSRAADGIGRRTTTPRTTTGFFFAGGIDYSIPNFDFGDDDRIDGGDMHANYRWLDVAELCAANGEQIPTEHRKFIYGMSDRFSDGETISGKQAKYLGRLFHQYILGTFVR